MHKSSILLVILGATVACGARTGLGVDEHDAAASPPEVDAGPDLDAGVDAPIDVGIDAPPDVWVPPCPDSVSVAAREATVPIDIIWALDSSGSMIDDVERMNANIRIFWDAITETNLAANVIFVAQRGYGPGAPAGFPGRYVEVDYRVDSHAGLLALLAAYDDYDRYLRPDAITHFIVVTDDESLAIQWEDFRASMESMLGHEFTFHAVASEYVTPSPTNMFGACYHDHGFAMRPGFEYYELAAATGGLQLSICNDDWAELISQLTERIVVAIPLPCGYLLPRAPSGRFYDADRFTVLWQVPGEVGPRVIGRAPAGACTNGWTFAEADDRVELCPEICAEVEATGGRITVDLGCD